ncbi:hypothetical protein [Verrucomicrobium spinosum]|uniref:hypothetical protein n=1 Tax=Verrucomicrobium spinosum TaxID=2736 RepID=UPI0001745B70|nr:hypothetical protein [Verrucomicrobium spinosum]
MLRLDLHINSSFIPPRLFKASDGTTQAQTDEGLMVIPSPDFDSRNFSANDVLTFFVEQGTNIAVGIISSYIYNLLQSKQAKEVVINQEVIITVETSLKDIEIIIEHER